MLDRNVRNMQHIWVVKSACKHVIHIYLLFISNKQKSYLIKFYMKNYDFFHTVMEHVGSHGIMSEKLDKFTPAKFSKDGFSLILCQAHDDNQLKMAAKQLSVDVD